MYNDRSCDSSFGRLANVGLPTADQEDRCGGFVVLHKYVESGKAEEKNDSGANSWLRYHKWFLKPDRAAFATVRSLFL